MEDRDDEVLRRVLGGFHGSGTRVLLPDKRPPEFVVRGPSGEVFISVQGGPTFIAGSPPGETCKN